METDESNTATHDGPIIRELDDGTYAVLHTLGPGESLSTTVALAVAKVLNQDPIALDPLSEFVNPDALDGFVTSTTDCFLSFTYMNCRVSIDADRTIQIQRT